MVPPFRGVTPKAARGVFQSPAARGVFHRQQNLTSGQVLLTRLIRSEGVTMSVSRIPNLSFTTTTSPWAIR
jgi:hypothetical protein